MGLANVKRKQRISADPQNKTWKDDTEKFGYKMLQKMGWKEGSGLGKNQDGQTEHLVVQYKPDTIGLGVKKKDAEEVTYQQLTAFEALLKHANKNERKLESEEKQKKVKKVKNKDKTKDSSKVEKPSRLAHRRKFIQSKQVSQYSKEQLKEILGV